VRDGQTTATTLALTAAPRYTLQGTVADGGGFPVAGITVKLAGTPLSAVTTDAAGGYRIDGVPPGQYPLTTSAGGCLSASTRWVTVAGASTVHVTPTPVLDASGYHCQQAAPPYPSESTMTAVEWRTRWRLGTRSEPGATFAATRPTRCPTKI
jgi:Carboxypeptidase regulatory-like domain